MKENKPQYISADMEIIVFETEDVITTSCTTDGPQRDETEISILLYRTAKIPADRTGK